jgi:hypothetical protein
VRRGIWGIVIVGLWLLLATPILAQAGSVRLEDPDGLLGGGAASVRDAAQRLANEGAEVIVLVAGRAAGTTRDSADNYLNQFLSENNLAPSFTQLRPNQVVFFVAPQAQQTALRFGQRWIEQLRPAERNIQQQQMNPRFVAGDLAGGLVAGIDAVHTTINPSNLPYYIIGGALAVTAIGAIMFPLIHKRRVAAESLAGARERLEQARRAAGGAIADLGQLVRTAQEKARFDQYSYSRQDAERVQTMQANGLQLFQQAQAAFDAAEEQQNAKSSLNVNDYAAITSGYAESQQLAERATAVIREVEQLRVELDARGTPSTGATTRLNE